MYYGRTENGGAHFPFNFQLVQVDKQCNATCVSELVNDWMNNKPENASANWVVSLFTLISLIHPVSKCNVQ